MTKAFYTLATLLLLIACGQQPPLHNQLTNEEKAAGWQLLFDGKTTAGWHLYNKGPIASAWTAQNGELICRPNTPELMHGDLVTDRQFENYELKFEWKIPKAGNSGVFINVVERPDIAAAWASGPEYQLLETTHHDYAANEKKRAGCLYGFLPQKNEVTPKSTNEWNQAVIRQQNGKIEFYLNSALTAEMDLNATAWHEMVAATHFNAYPSFGKQTKGHIALQDWTTGIAFRNIKIRPLD